VIRTASAGSLPTTQAQIEPVNAIQDEGGSLYLRVKLKTHVAMSGGISNASGTDAQAGTLGNQYDQ
jgi:hypothetical protein